MGLHFSLLVKRIKAFFLKLPIFKKRLPEKIAHPAETVQDAALGLQGRAVPKPDAAQISTEEVIAEEEALSKMNTVDRVKAIANQEAISKEEIIAKAKDMERAEAAALAETAAKAKAMNKPSGKGARSGGTGSPEKRL